ncbi:uncharacterized protein F4812DRAFT_435563 [Daldinia caldariorum]|uniref:uncharacterized protein n=1 Tax=Daldinia caldariorum TaxID=326644 RepID=UPI0020088E74|nr:uncharacterized protein F4812DRAFT_435563 [Daldinia caldariorum]KAI1466014.1 hypothetical protein F4812DRAFT_435563 [Daldinia caldariorum]
MASPSLDSVDEDSGSPRDGYGGFSLTSGRCSSSSRSIHSNDSSDQGINSCTIGYDDQVDGGYTHQSIPDHEDKGKAPVRVRRDFVNRKHPQDAEILLPNANPHSRTELTNTESQNENLESRESPPPPSPPTATTAYPVNSAYKEPLDEPLSEHGVGLRTQLLSPKPSLEALSVESDCESFRTASPKLYFLDDDREPDQDQNEDQRRRRDAEESDLESEPQSQPQPQPQPADPGPAACGPHAGEEAEAPAFRSLQYGDPGWEKSADRPPKKLPIRFKDAVGRKFVFPWEKAKTWAGMERLIRNCFAYVDIIGPHVIKGHYDLFTFHLPFSTDAGFEMAPDPTEAPLTTTAAAAAAGGTSAQLPVPHAPTPPPALALTPVEQSAVTILPELWEDLVEPGMFILMQMWPMAPLVPPPPMQQQHHPHHAHHHHHPPPLPPAPPVHPNVLDWIGGGGGLGVRGRGRGRGRGGMGPGPGPGGGRGGGGGGRGMNPALPVWMMERTPTPRGKTRTRRNGP